MWNDFLKNVSSDPQRGDESWVFYKVKEWLGTRKFKLDHSDACAEVYSRTLNIMNNVDFNEYLQSARRYFELHPASFHTMEYSPEVSHAIKSIYEVYGPEQAFASLLLREILGSRISSHHIGGGMSGGSNVLHLSYNDRRYSVLVRDETYEHFENSVSNLESAILLLPEHERIEHAKSKLTQAKDELSRLKKRP